jgi:hypothetical protein
MLRIRPIHQVAMTPQPKASRVGSSVWKIGGCPIVKYSTQTLAVTWSCRMPAEFLNFPIWRSPATATRWCKKCIRSRRVHEAIRAQIRKNPRRWAIKRPRRPAAVLQISRGQERKFDIIGDANFGALSTVAFAL